MNNGIYKRPLNISDKKLKYIYIKTNTGMRLWEHTLLNKETMYIIIGIYLITNTKSKTYSNLFLDNND